MNTSHVKHFNCLTFTLCYNQLMRNTKRSPLIIGFVSNLMMATKIENVVRHLGFRVEWVETAVSISKTEQDLVRHQPGEALQGREGVLLIQITSRQPSLLLFDLTNQDIPWQRWIAVLKSSPATRRIPILCFGPHIEADKLQAARHAGADLVVARSRFTRQMSKLLLEQARIFDEAALAQTCQNPLPELVLSGLALFNQGEFYKCHDALEEAWRQETGPVRELYRGILQVGIAYFQIERGNYRGALKMLLRVRQWLAPLPDICRTVHIEQLRQDVEAVQAVLADLGPDKIAEFDKTLFRPIDYNSRLE